MSTLHRMARSDRAARAAVRAASAYEFMAPAKAARYVSGGQPYAEGEAAPALADEGTATWSGVLTFENVMTGDGRLIEPNALRWENLPIPLRYAPVDNGGHDGAQVVGTIDSIERTAGGKISAKGRFDLGSEIGREAFRHVSEGLTTGVSVDLDDVSFEVRIAGEVMDELDAMFADPMPEDGAAEEPERETDDEGRVTVAKIGTDDEVMVTTDARVRAATIVAIPAFADARIAADKGDDGEDRGDSLAAQPAESFAAETGDTVRWMDGETERTGVVTQISDDGATATVDVGDGESVEVPVDALTEVDGDDEEDGQAPPPPPAQNAAEVRPLVAGAGPVRPPRGWFDDPGLTEPTALTVTEDGRVYGHLALWGTCHVGYSGQCVSPPNSMSDYAYFRTGAVLTDDGTEVAVGPITMDTLHASLGRGVTAASATRHYEDTGRAVAYIAAGEDAHGVWVAGSVRADASAEQIRALRASPLSGDWRPVGTGLELVATLAVNLPGFPVPRTKALVASGRMAGLVAAGMLPPREVIPPGQPGALSVDDLRYLRSLAQRERERERRSTPADKSPDPSVRAKALALRVHAPRYRVKTRTTA